MQLGQLAAGRHRAARREPVEAASVAHAVRGLVDDERLLAGEQLGQAPVARPGLGRQEAREGERRGRGPDSDSAAMTALGQSTTRTRPPAATTSLTTNSPGSEIAGCPRRRPAHPTRQRGGVLRSPSPAPARCARGPRTRASSRRSGRAAAGVPRVLGGDPVRRAAPRGARRQVAEVADRGRHQVERSPLRRTSAHRRLSPARRAGRIRVAARAGFAPCRRPRAAAQAATLAGSPLWSSSHSSTGSMTSYPAPSSDSSAWPG